MPNLYRPLGANDGPQTKQNFEVGRKQTQKHNFVTRLSAHSSTCRHR